jgi:hypothetical protein
MKDKTKLDYIKNMVIGASKAAMLIETVHKDDLDAKGLLCIIYHLCSEILEVCDD